MFELSALLLFMTAALGLLVIPGPAVTFIVARTVEHGRFAGIISILGITLASLVHISFAALGLSSLLVASAMAFLVVKYLGAAYLIYLGIQALRAEPQVQDPQAPAQAKPWRIFRQGFVVNLLNPKAALFFFAFLPQFVSPEQGSVTLQIYLLGFIFLGLAFLSDGFYVMIAGAARNFLSGNIKMARLQKNFAGVIYLLLGVTTAVSGNK